MIISPKPRVGARYMPLVVTAMEKTGCETVIYTVHTLRQDWQMNTATREKTKGKAQWETMYFINNLIYLPVLAVILLLFLSVGV